MKGRGSLTQSRRNAKLVFKIDDVCVCLSQRLVPYGMQSAICSSQFSGEVWSSSSEGPEKK